MVSATTASRKFAVLQQEQDILTWRYMAETSPRRRRIIGFKMLSLKLRHNLLASFYGAALDLKQYPQGASWADADKRALQYAVLNGWAPGGLSSVVKRVRLMERCMNK